MTRPARRAPVAAGAAPAPIILAQIPLGGVQGGQTAPPARATQPEART